MSHSDLVRPPRLRPGDKIAVCAPSGPAPDDRLRAGLNILAGRYRIECLWDAAETQGYLAADDDRRAESFNRALRDSEFRAIFVLRGGYGAMRILPALDTDAMRGDPKPIVGFSDATAILAWATQECNVQAIHGPVVTHLPVIPAAEIEWLFRLLEEPVTEGVLPWDLHQVGAPSEEEISARIFGGNLCLVSHLSKTGFSLPANETSIALLAEDVGEQPYAIDRYLTGLSLSGALSRVSCGLLGSFTNCEGQKFPTPTVETVLDERFSEFGLPALAGLPVGHGEHNWALPIGGRALVNFSNSTVALVEGAVS